MQRDIDLIVTRVKRECPKLIVQQLKVSHPGADDDGLWFFLNPDSSFEVQLESPKGMCPFLIETPEYDGREVALTVDAALATLRSWLHLQCYEKALDKNSLEYD